MLYLDLFFDLHGVLADLEVVSNNYGDYLAHILIPFGFSRSEINLIHKKAFTQWIEEINQLFESTNKNFDPLDFMQKYGQIDRKWEEYLLSFVPKDDQKLIRPQLETSKVEYEALATGKPILYPEVLNVLEALLKFPNLRMHIASSASSYHVKGAVVLHNLEKYFVHLIGYDTVQAPKKFAQGKYFENMLKLTKADPKCSIFVGDSIEEAKLALKFGIDFIMINRTDNPHMKEKGGFSFNIIKDLNELIPLIIMKLETQ